MPELAKKIRARRKELKLTQKEVADACGISQQAYAKYENGEIKHPSYIIELSKILKAPPEALLRRPKKRLSYGLENHKNEWADSLGDQSIHIGTYNTPPLQIPVFRYNTESKIANPNPFNAGTSPIAWLETPYCLHHATQGVAFYIVGDGLSPLYRNGYTIFVDLNKIPAIEQDCLCQIDDTIMIGTFLGREKGKYKLKCLNNNRYMTIEKNRPFQMHKIVGLLTG